jgi:hypothetical protein
MTRSSALLLVLALLSVALLLTGERKRQNKAREQVQQELRELDRVAATRTVDTVLHLAGLGKFKRATASPKGAHFLRTEVRVQVPKGFVTIHLVTMLKDSLRRYDADLVATENFKEKSSAIHLLYRRVVFESIHLTKQTEQKGAPPSPSKKVRAAAHKGRR